MSFEKTHPPAQKATGGFSAELCALIADHTARHPRLAPLFLPFWAILRRLFARLDALLDAFRAGTLALPEPRAPRATPRTPAARQPRARRPGQPRRAAPRPDSVPARSEPGSRPATHPAPVPHQPVPRVAIARARPQPPLLLFSALPATMPNRALIVPLS
jgi:hypothetical protein